MEGKMSTSIPPRRFKVEAIETSSKSSRARGPEAMETTTRTSPGSSQNSQDNVPERKFLPQPIETTRSSNKHSALSALPQPEPRTFVPQLIGSSTSRRKQGSSIQKVEVSSSDRDENMEVSSAGEDLLTRRRFSPLLIDSAKRTRRVGDTRPAHLPSDRTDAIPGELDGIRRVRKPQVIGVPTPPDHTLIGTPSHSLAISSAEARRLGIPVPRRLLSSQSSDRQHSFRVPDLDPIDSSESAEGSQGSSLSSSPSSSSDMSYQMYLHATRMRESIDASSSTYLLELAAKAAEKQLREQALAAFPNDDRHVPVHHYIGHESDKTAPSSRSELDHRRFGSVNWELKDMRRHHERLEANREKEEKQREARRAWHRKQEKADPWSNPFKTTGKDMEMDRMRRTARPPMLGTDIVFPRCPSPEPARFDVTQGSYTERSAMCYLTDETDDSASCEEGLWAKKEASKPSQCSLWSQTSSRAPSTSGLWGGFCRGIGGGASPPRGPTGLMTPHVADEDSLNHNPFEDIGKLPAQPDQVQMPPSPPASNSGMASLDEKLELEQNIEAEFTDEFVTQVYNYLSLGYPSLARKYDEEMSKISRIPIAELRQDDELPTSRGYIRLGEGECAKDDGIDVELCARWKALRLYVHEWARQQPRMSEQNHTSHGGFGVTVRRGSWAW